MSVFCLAIGRDPGKLEMAVVNHEMGTSDFDPCSHFTSGCILGNKVRKASDLVLSCTGITSEYSQQDAKYLLVLDYNDVTDNKAVTLVIKVGNLIHPLRFVELKKMYTKLCCYA